MDTYTLIMDQEATTHALRSVLNERGSALLARRAADGRDLRSFSLVGRVALVTGTVLA